MPRAAAQVWTLFDYYGEPSGGWPRVSSSFGQYDLAGFAKASAFWYRTQWLLRTPDRIDKPYATGSAHEVHLVESWENPDSWPQTEGQGTRTITAYTSASEVELFVNGASAGSRRVASMADGGPTWAEWEHVPWAAGELLAVARDAAGKDVARDGRVTSGAALRLRLTLDAPSAASGTGAAPAG